jgi:FMN phosphatase YigB (HAD superfamily)
MIVYLDLDRTLFKTANMDTVWEYIGRVYPEAAEAFDSAEDYFHYVGEQYYYDMSSHLASLGLDPEEVYASVTNSELADGRLEIDGSKELIETLTRDGYEVQVLTFGSDDYQRFKASLCPALRGVPIVTTLRAKSEVLDELGVECWLVDDRPLGDELPGNVSFVQISPDGAAVPYDADWTVKKSLFEVKEFFDAISH